MRGAPRHHANLFAVNKVLTGNDGRDYKIVSNGKYKKWVPLTTTQEYKKKVEMLLKNNDINYVKEKITGIQNLQITEMGSCQYAGVYSMFRLLEILSFYYSDPFDAVNIVVKAGMINKNYLDDLCKNLNDSEIKCSKLRKVDDFFKLCRKHERDLWYTCDVAIKNIFPNTSIDVKKAHGRGPTLNVIQQSNNNETGIIMYILLKSKIVKRIEIFFDFST